MAFTIGTTKVLNLPEQVEENVKDIADLNTKVTAIGASQTKSTETSETALTTANEAKTTADTAVTTANEAKTAADSVSGALDTANTALTKADSAIETANSALTAAQTAQTTAETFYNENKTVVDEAKTALETISTSNDATFGKNVEIDGDLTLNSRSNIKLTETPADTLVLTSELEADKNALETKIEANSALIDTKADTTTFTAFENKLNSNSGIARLAGTTVTLPAYLSISATVTLSNIVPSLSDYSNISLCFNNFSVKHGENEYMQGPIVMPDFDKTFSANNSMGAFTYMHNPVVRLGNLSINGVSSYGLFAYSDITDLQVADGKTVKFTGYCDFLFTNCNKLKTIGAIDMSGARFGSNAFTGCSALKEINCTHFQSSFNISASTAFEESDLVNIISNLDTVTTAQTLTMGATNLAKLTQDEILVATGKGWTLA